MTRTALPVFLAVALVASILCASATACPASYVKKRAQDARKCHLGDKINQIADKYMTEKGVDPTSSQGQVIKEYVVGTTLVDHEWATRGRRVFFFFRSKRGHRVDNKSVDECVQDAMKCSHHAQHFGDGVRAGGVPITPQASSMGG